MDSLCTLYAYVSVCVNERVCTSTTEMGHCDDVRRAFKGPETTVSNTVRSGVTDKKQHVYETCCISLSLVI